MIKSTPAPPSELGLQQRVERLYDHLYANSVVRTPAGICFEVGKILHTGLFREEVEGRVPAFEIDAREIRALTDRSQGSRRQLANLVRQEFSRMNSLWRLYESDAKILLSDFDLCYTCCQLSGLSISAPNRDVLGDVFEIFRSQWAKRMGGQFFTDQRVTSLAMVLLDFDPLKGDDLIDICAGTGGFLLAGLNHIHRLLEAKHCCENMESRLVDLACRSLRGQEVDGEVAAVANGTLQARLGVRGRTLVMTGDSLAKDAFDSGASTGLSIGSHMCAASNPPFGTKITIKDLAILDQFDLARRAAGQTRLFGDSLCPTAPDILFLERNLQMLKPGEGRLAIVLPYQILSGPKTLRVREWLLRNVRLIAVIDLPPETFQPHTGTKTSLVVMERRTTPPRDFRNDMEYRVFMSMPRWIGHDRRGHAMFRRTPDGRPTDVVLTDFPEVENAFLTFRRGEDPRNVHAMSFAVTSVDIHRDPLLRINALFHRPAVAATEDWSQRLKAKGWKFVRLRDVSERVFYPGRFKRHYVDFFPGAVPFLGGSNITEFITTASKWFSPEDPKLEELRVRTGWLLVTRSGTTGIVASVPAVWDGYAMSEHIIRIVPDPGKLDPCYLLAFLQSKCGQEQLARGVFGSVIDEITPEFVGDLEVPVPRSKASLRAVAQCVREGEEARNLGAEEFSNGVRTLEHLLDT